jgi:hypothetical protein
MTGQAACRVTMRWSGRPQGKGAGHRRPIGHAVLGFWGLAPGLAGEFQAGGQARNARGEPPRGSPGTCRQGRGNLIGLLPQYAGYMLRHFGGPAPAEYLSRHPDEYVVAVRLPLKPADMPRRPDGSVDIEAFPERIFGPEHVKRHPDGSTEYTDIPESKFREVDQRVLHRATCGTLKDHDDQYQMICGTRDELEQIMEEHDKLCPDCL